MDINSIVEKLEKAFLEKKAEGLLIDAIGVAPAFRGLIKNSYTLGVSAPSMVEWHEYRKIDVMVDLLFEVLTVEERIGINTVKIYDNKKELRQNLSFDFKDHYSNDFEGVVQFDNDLFEVA